MSFTTFLILFISFIILRVLGKAYMRAKRKFDTEQMLNEIIESRSDKP